jgi:hypothetical protein
MPIPISKTPATGDFCKLSPAELAARRHELIPGLVKRADKVEDIPNGLRFTFTSKQAFLPISPGSWIRSRTAAASSACNRRPKPAKAQ